MLKVLSYAHNVFKGLYIETLAERILVMQVSMFRQEGVTICICVGKSKETTESKVLTN